MLKAKDKVSQPRILLIGAGVAGLAASIHLSLAGFLVQVFETADGPGGKLTQFKLDGYRFDRGPSLFTMPDWVDELFYMAGEDPRYYFNYRRLDPVTHYFFADGTRLNAWFSRKQFLDECQRVLGEPPEAVGFYLAEAAKKYQITAPFFVEASLHRWQTYWNRRLPAALVALPSLGLFQTMNQAHENQFKNPKTVQLFNRYATYNGSNPYSAPAMLSVIPHFEFNVGAFLPVGGMFQITSSLHRLAERLGVEFHFGKRVQQIRVKNDRVEGIVVDGNIISSPIVLSNADVFTTYRHLLPNHKAPERVLRQPRSSSALIFYWGIKKKFDELHVHNIFFSSDYKKEFYQLFSENTIPDDPTIYVNITSKLEPSDAPPDCENWFVMINVPPNSGQNWDELIAQAKERILTRLSYQLCTAIGGLIACEAVLEPRTIESLTGSWQGSIYGTSSNNRMAAFLRHANRSSKIRGLYFCGGSVHPGGGIPLCLQSGKIAAQLIKEAFL